MHDNAEVPTMTSTDKENENNQKYISLPPAYKPPRLNACSAILLRKWISRRLPDIEDTPASLSVISGCDIEHVMVGGECVRIGGAENELVEDFLASNLCRILSTPHSMYLNGEPRAWNVNPSKLKNIHSNTWI